MTKPLNYHEQMTIKTHHQLISTLEKLPDFCKYFFIGTEQSTQPRTQLHYAYDLTIFFRYIKQTNPSYSNINIHDFPITMLDAISAFEIEQYLSYLKYYTDENGIQRTNGQAGIKSKLSALRSLYRYCFKHHMIKSNITELVDLPQINEKKIVRLNEDEVDKLLTSIEETTDSGSTRQNAWNEKLKLRDYAIVSLLLGTGIRVSECVGIDTSDINWTNCSIKIIRKGGDEDFIYFSDEVKTALTNYANQRKSLTIRPGHENAFFLSKNQTRISVRSIQEMTHKYSKDIKVVTPHKFRSTFGTNLYVATKDIYLVANALGHTNVETTRKHYAEIPEQIKENARNTLHLRKKKNE